MDDDAVWTVTENLLSSKDSNSYWVRLTLTTPPPKPFVSGWYRGVYPGCPPDYITKFTVDPRQGEYDPVPTWGKMEFDKAWQRVTVEDVHDETN